MTVSLKHKFQSQLPDGVNPSLIRPSNWNDEHDLTIPENTIVGRVESGEGPATALTQAEVIAFLGDDVGGIDSVEEDPAPKLGGDLDLNGHKIPGIDYDDLTNKPTLGSAAAEDTTAFATAAQGALADSATQPGDLATVATSGTYSDLTGTPTLGTAAAEDATAFATAAQGTLADSALQSSDIGSSVQAYDADLTTWAGKTAPSGTVVGTSDTQTVTNKTLSLDSNTVQFTAPGTGAVARSAKDALGEIINVKNFGATGDGSTDDSTALDAAFTYANTLSRKAVYFPPGNYIYAGSGMDITGGDWTTFGDGPASRITRTSDGDIFAPDMTAGSFGLRNIHFHSLMLHSTQSAGAGRANTNGIHVLGDVSTAIGLNTFKVHDMVFSCLEAGIRIGVTPRATFNGVASLENMSGIDISRNQFGSLGGVATNRCNYGILWDGGTGAGQIISGNIIFALAACIKAGDGTASVQDTLITNNHLSNAGYGIYMAGGQTAGTYNAKVHASHNQYDGCTVAWHFEYMSQFINYPSSVLGAATVETSNITAPYWYQDSNDVLQFAAQMNIQTTMFALRFTPTGSSASGDSIYLPASDTIGIAPNALDAMRFKAPSSAGNYLIAKGQASGTTIAQLGVEGTDTNVHLSLASKGTGTVQMASSSMFASNGSVATSLGSVGPTGSHTTVQKWLRIIDSAGASFYIPCF